MPTVFLVGILKKGNNKANRHAVRDELHKKMIFL